MRRLAIGVIIGLLTCQPAKAGMASFGLEDIPRVVRLSELTRERIEAISFFVLVFLIASWLVQKAWNSLAKGFSSIPRLSYGRALGVVLLWGLLFTLVLTMISGARELMTPGAWKKKGLTFQLAEPPPPELGAEFMKMRWYQLDRLGRALQQFAAEHEGRFPSAEEQTRIPWEAWTMPIERLPSYQYRPGLYRGQDVPLAYEGSEAGPRRFVLFTDGRIVQMSPDELASLLEKGAQP